MQGVCLRESAASNLCFTVVGGMDLASSIAGLTQQLKLAKVAQQVIPITALLDKRPTYALAPVVLPERKVCVVVVAERPPPSLPTTTVSIATVCYRML